MSRTVQCIKLGKEAEGLPDSEGEAEDGRADGTLSRRVGQTDL